MFGRNGGARAAVAEVAGRAASYVDPLRKDEQLRRRLAAAVTAGVAARRRARRQTGLTGTVRRLATDQVLRAQLRELSHQLRAARKEVEKARSHRLRNTVLFLGGTAMAAVAVRRFVSGGSDDSPPAGSGFPGPEASVEPPGGGTAV
jgi:hypothetical protein